jgi:hypothetical protein
MGIFLETPRLHVFKQGSVLEIQILQIVSTCRFHVFSQLKFDYQGLMSTYKHGVDGFQIGHLRAFVSFHNVE